ncbi:Mediator of RNA polymerase II transcription subunit 15a [Vitis vinifera]|uniref:Mediator of RNA polymerase II transcription subunit 15a n=1 Tax=Vitis vinifera TaxID=29760 RepID=A0A438C519_VITVI|nr:Mediator of RNA polymerase II transcription subunit 15a [Vitis vinifera]
MDTLKRHLPISGPEGLHELRKIVERFEEKIYSAATSQSDYLQKISLKMLTMETKSFNVATNSLPSNFAGHSKKSLMTRNPLLGKRPSYLGYGSSQWLLLSSLPLGWKDRVMERSIEFIGAMIGLGGRDRVVCQHLDLDDVVPRPHWMMLCTHECLFSMQADGPRFDERSCEGLVAT